MTQVNTFNAMRSRLLITFCLFLASSSVSWSQLHPNDCNATVTSGNEIPCGDPQFPCCTVYNACNGTMTACNNYDPDFSATGGCDLSCTPIDSGVLFLLLGGAAFGGLMIVRRRKESIVLQSERIE